MTLKRINKISKNPCFEWIKEDEEILAKYYPTLGAKVRDKLWIRRSDIAIRSKAQEMGLKVKWWSPKWLPIEDQIMSEYCAAGNKYSYTALKKIYEENNLPLRFHKSLKRRYNEAMIRIFDISIDISTNDIPF